jgi:hypothetical protein
VTKPAPTSPAADILRGAKAIGEWMGCDEREAKWALAQGRWPAAKDGKTYVSSKRALTKWWENKFSPEATAKPADPEPMRIRRKRPSMPRLRSEVPIIDDEEAA